MTCIHPILAEEQYTIGFEAEAEGTFIIIRGFVEGGTVVAIGEGECELEGDAVVTNSMDSNGDGEVDVYFDFPAVMDLSGELIGEIHPVKIVDDELDISEETWIIELEFWNRKNAGGLFAPDIADNEDVIFIQSVFPGSPDATPSTCLGYRLDLKMENDEGVDRDEFFTTKRRKDKAYGVVAGLWSLSPSMEALTFTLDNKGGPYTIIFLEDTSFQFGPPPHVTIEFEGSVNAIVELEMN